MYWEVWKYLYMFVCVCELVCLCVHVCVVACMCMCGDQVVPGHSLVGSGGQTPCPYLLKALLNHDIGAVPTVRSPTGTVCMYKTPYHPGCTIATAITMY